MATPTIKIDGSVSGAGTPGVSRDDLILAETWTFTDPANGAGTYAWVLRTRPVGSSATLSGAATPTATLVPDIAGTYLVELTFNGTDRSGVDNAIGEFISDQGGAAAKLSGGTRIPGAGETVQYGTEGWHPAQDSVLRKHDARSGIDSKAHGSVFYSDSGTDPAALAPGTSGQILQTLGAGANPQWADAAVASATPPVNVTKAAASAGSAAQVSRQDHKHDITTAAALEITDSTEAEGTATTLARSDHTHGHGNRGAGSLHAVASAIANGFMSSADKNKLDGYPAAPVGGPLVWGNANVGAAADTRYLNPGSDQGTASASRNWSVVMMRAGTLKNLYVRHNVSAGNGNNVVYTIHKNGTPTALTVTLATGAVGQASDTSNTVTVAAGDYIDLVAVKGSTIVSGAIYAVGTAEVV